MKKLIPIVCCIIFLLPGCAHKIAFQKLDYSISGRKYNKGLVAVIDKNTLNNTVSIRSFATGIVHSWDARPGEMLKQVSDIEFPQIFKQYSQTDSPITSLSGNDVFFLVLTIPRYQFKNFHAYFTVKATLLSKEKIKLMEKTYKEEGSGQSSKMVWAGAFGMKSAVRQSSLDALKKIFSQIRSDLSTIIGQ